MYMCVLYALAFRIPKLLGFATFKVVDTWKRIFLQDFLWYNTYIVCVCELFQVCLVILKMNAGLNRHFCHILNQVYFHDPEWDGRPGINQHVNYTITVTQGYGSCMCNPSYCSFRLYHLMITTTVLIGQWYVEEGNIV